MSDQYHSSNFNCHAFKVYESHSSAMVVNITTNKPVFHIRGLNAGTEYFVEIYSVNSNGISEHTIFETFTLQVSVLLNFMLVNFTKPVLLD